MKPRSRGEWRSRNGGSHGDERSGSEHQEVLMDEVVGRANGVRQNKGSPGIDGMSVEELRHWGEIRVLASRGEIRSGDARRSVGGAWAPSTRC